MTDSTREDGSATASPHIGAVDAGFRARFEPEELAIVLSRWDLGPIESAEPFAKGSPRAPKIHLRTATGEWLLKRRKPGQDATPRVAFSQAIQTHLAGAGVPVAALVPDRSGRTAVHVQGRVYELFEFLPGRPSRVSTAIAAEAGRMLARFHTATDDFQHDDETLVASGGWHAVRGLRRTMDELPDRIAAVELDVDPDRLGRTCRFLRRAYDDANRRAEELGVMSSPPGLVHGDWHPGNLLAEADQVTAVLDFDSARVEPRITDLANACLQYSIDRSAHEDPASWPGILAYDRMRSLLAGYEAGRQPLEPAEREALPWLMTEALVIETVVPIAATGRFGRFRGSSMLVMAERKVRWLRERRDRLMAYLADV